MQIHVFLGGGPGTGTGGRDRDRDRIRDRAIKHQIFTGGSFGPKITLDILFECP